MLCFRYHVGHRTNEVFWNENPLPLMAGFMELFCSVILFFIISVKMLLYLEFITAVTTYLDGLTMKDIAAWTAAVTLSGRCRALVGPSHLELCDNASPQLSLWITVHAYQSCFVGNTIYCSSTNMSGAAYPVIMNHAWWTAERRPGYSYMWSTDNGYFLANL